MSSFATSLKVIRPLCRVNLATVPKRSRGYHTAEFKVSGSKVSGTNPRLDLESVSRLPRTMKSFSLTGKNALVTGGARGLGYNMATALVEAGAEKVVLVDRNAEAGEAAATELHEKYGVTARFLEMDVTDLHAIHPTIEKIFNRWGSLDVVINSAGIADSGIPAETYSLEDFVNLMNINVNGLFAVTQAIGMEMIKRKQTGSIINIASMSSHVVNTPQDQCCYNASKAAVRHLSASLATEWAKYNIRVNSISPGYMDTKLNQRPQLEPLKTEWKKRTPMARLGKEDELNGLAVFLASDASSFMTATDVIIDGGYCAW